VTKVGIIGLPNDLSETWGQNESGDPPRSLVTLHGTSDSASVATSRIRCQQSGPAMPIPTAGQAIA
jgi:hypothetical protein